MTAGPASGTASCSTKKMPVPTVAPTPNMVSWKVPKLRSSSGPSCGPFFTAIGFLRVSCSLSVTDMGAPSRGRNFWNLVPPGRCWDSAAGRR